MQIEEILYVLLEVGKKISRESNIDTLLDVLGCFARDIVEAERCSIFIYDKSRNELWTKVAHGVNEIRISANSGVAGYAVLTRELQIATDVYNDFRFNMDVDKDTGYVTKTLIAIPLFDKKDEVLGVIEVINKKNGYFTNIDAELILLISNYIGATIENSILYRKVRDTQTKLIYKLSSAAEFKDIETSEHTIRVAHYSCVIARNAGFTEEYIEMVELVSPMHDVGKIGIPDEILRKPGKLTMEEFEVIKTHSTIGYNILQDDENEMLNNAAMIARDHHEKYDGTGYPKGSSGEEISILGRIVAVADVFDALTSKRPYKEPWSIERAIKLLNDEKATHFDPQLVDMFLSSLDRVREIHNEYKET